MEDNFKHIVYSKNVVEFVTVANEFCLMLESCGKLTEEEFVAMAQKILPLLYLKGSVLPKNDTELDEDIEKFVNESDWSFIHSMVKEKVGANDEYLEVFEEDMQYSDAPVVTTISENMADIYQDIKDFITAYKVGTIAIMNDALWELNNNFAAYWGQKTVNVLRQIHQLATNSERLGQEVVSKGLSEMDMSDSILAQRQKEWGDNVL